MSLIAAPRASPPALSILGNQLIASCAVISCRDLRVPDNRVQTPDGVNALSIHAVYAGLALFRCQYERVPGARLISEGQRIPCRDSHVPMIWRLFSPPLFSCSTSRIRYLTIKSAYKIRAVTNVAISQDCALQTQRTSPL